MHNFILKTSVQFSSVAQSCPTLWDPMNRSTPGLPVHHHLPEFTQTHVHRVSDAIQPSHPRSSPIPPSIRVFSNESTLLMRWPKYWSFSFSIIPSKEHPRLISLTLNRWNKNSHIYETLSYSWERIIMEHNLPVNLPLQYICLFTHLAFFFWVSLWIHGPLLKMYFIN